MRKTFLAILFFAANAMWGIVACGQTINLKVADSLQVLSQKWADAYKSMHPEADIRVSAGGTAGVLAALANKQADLVMVPRAMRFKEIQACEAAFGQRPGDTKLAVCGVAVYVKSNNPVGELNYNELYEIFHGEAKSWKEFEGGKDLPISLYVIVTNSPLGELFNAEVMSGRGFPEEAHTLAAADLLKAVAGDPQGIGFGPLAAADHLKLVSIKRAPSSTPMIPTAENIGGRIYPISRCVFAYANPAADGKGIKQYLDWIRSDAGQQVAREAGFYALSAALLSNQ